MPNLSTIHLLREADGVYFGDVTYSPGSTLGPRLQGDFQVVILLHGALTLTVDGQALDVPVGTLVLLKPGHQEHFAFSPSLPSRHVWCTVAVRHLTELATRLQAQGRLSPLTKPLQALMDIGLAMPEPGLALRDRVLVTTGQLLMHQVALEAEQRTTVAHAPAALLAAQRYIHESLGEHLDVTTIARAANVSPQHLARLFRYHVGTSPMRYVWERRRERGAEMLIQTGLAVGEIALLLGYQTAYHFSRAVRERYGVSPRGLRQRSWG
jgi:AraC family transcriptional regulator of arabinose operon